LIQSVLSLEYVRVPVAARSSGLAVNPTADAVAMAFTAAGVNPTSGDWQTGSWETDSTTTPATYFARCLVGPGGTFVPVVTTYDVWLKVTDAPEIPARKVGNLQIV
jgi:hypothetical protein